MSTTAGNEGSITASVSDERPSARPGSSSGGSATADSGHPPVCTEWVRIRFPDGRWEQQWAEGVASWWFRKCLVNGRWVEQQRPRVESTQQSVDPATLR